MQRSASASSSYHMPTPPLLAGAYQSSSPFYGTPVQGHPDWTAMQLAQSYLPSLSPAGLPIPTFNGQHPQSGRNTPSPLPSLGELRSLQRSNSAMARAHAMSKLTGGRDTPSEEDLTIKRLPSHPGLQRADTLGPLAQRSLGLGPPAKEAEAEPKTEAADTLALPRPRLQRSFTVSSSNMGEERRSAVGRRMVMRLGERRAARQQEEEEVRRLWEEKRAAADRPDNHENDHEAEDEPKTEAGDDATPAISQDVIPVLHRSSPADHAAATFSSTPTNDLLGVPDRPNSRSTTRSAEEAFEYEAHLRRSLSSRTARGAVGTVTEPIPRSEDDSRRQDEVEEHIHDPSIHQALEPLALPRPSYATPIRHTPQASSSTEATLQGQSPGESVMSRDGLGSMMFVMGGNGAGKADAWPSEVGDTGGSGWGTPAREPRERERLYAEHRLPQMLPSMTRPWPRVRPVRRTSTCSQPSIRPANHQLRRPRQVLRTARVSCPGKKLAVRKTRRCLAIRGTTRSPVASRSSWAGRSARPSTKDDHLLRARPKVFQLALNRYRTLFKISAGGNPSLRYRRVRLAPCGVWLEDHLPALAIMSSTNPLSAPSRRRYRSKRSQARTALSCSISCLRSPRLCRGCLELRRTTPASIAQSSRLSLASPGSAPRVMCCQTRQNCSIKSPTRQCPARIELTWRQTRYTHYPCLLLHQSRDEAPTTASAKKAGWPRLSARQTRLALPVVCLDIIARTGCPGRAARRRSHPCMRAMHRLKSRRPITTRSLAPRRRANPVDIGPPRLRYRSCRK